MKNTYYIVSIIHHFPVPILEIKLPEHDSYLEMWVEAETLVDAIKQIKHDEMNTSVLYGTDGKKFDFTYIDINYSPIKCNNEIYTPSKDEMDLINSLKQIYLDSVKKESANHH